MIRNAAEILVETLNAFGVVAIRTRQDRIRSIQARHEESAAFAATMHAKFTGKLGCCLATTGPSGIHLLNGLEREAIRMPLAASFAALATVWKRTRSSSGNRGTTRPMAGYVAAKAGQMYGE
jgi:glyoxylate carboligase